MYLLIVFQIYIRCLEKRKKLLQKEKYKPDNSMTPDQIELEESARSNAAIEEINKNAGVS